MHNSLAFRVGIEIGLTSVLESNISLCCLGDRNGLGFSVTTEIDLFFVQG